MIGKEAEHRQRAAEVHTRIIDALRLNITTYTIPTNLDRNDSQTNC